MSGYFFFIGEPVKIVNQLLDYSKAWDLPDIYLFTGNPIVTRKGNLVMGRGAAKQCRDSWKWIDIAFANLMPCDTLAWVFITDTQVLGWFQVKHHWAEPADLKLVHASAQLLVKTAEKHPNRIFHMNMPAVGNGQLDEKDVLPLLEPLPDNVIIYR